MFFGILPEANRRRRIMRKVIIGVLLISFIMVSGAFAGTIDSAGYRDKVSEVKGWTIYASDDDIDASAELITELDDTYTQLAAEEAIEVLSSSGSDTTQTVTVTGIDNAGKKCSETFTLAGVTVQTSTTTFRYVDQASVDIECVGVITIRKKTLDTLITSIPIGQLDAQMAQHFNGEYKSYVTGWSARCTSTTGTVLFELRWYPDDADCLDADTGYRVLDAIQFTNVHGSDSGIMGNPIKLPAGGWLCVYGTGGTTDCDGSVTVQGFDTRL